MQSAGLTMSAMSPSPSIQPAQVTHQRLEDKPKQSSTKTVSWAPEDKLCQARLFAPEDPPSSSGTVLQDLLQAKKTKFMHAVIPVSEDDLPPGFEGVAAKRARLDTAAVTTTMVSQISWRYPEKFLYDPLWQVVAGSESSEETAEQQREVRVLEAVYPRPSAIPTSPAEPHDTPTEMGNVVIPQIPLIPVEDEDEAVDEDNLPVTRTAGVGTVESLYPLSSDVKAGLKASQNQFSDHSKDSQKSESGGQLLGYSSASPTILKAGQPNPGLSTTYFRNADPNVAAAAAAAYAVVKAKESGTSIDHDLLIKILTNPLLIETLTASNPNLKNQSGDSSNIHLNREIMNGSSFRSNSEQSGGDSYNSAGMLGSHVKSTIMQGRQTHDSSFEGMILQGSQETLRTQGWDVTGGTGVVSQGRNFNAAGNNEQSNGLKGLTGQGKGTFGAPGPGSQGRFFPPRQDHFKELIQQHGTVRNINENHIRHSPTVALEEVKLGYDVERQRPAGLGTRGQPWTGNNLNTSSVSSRSDFSMHDRLGGEIVRPKIRKACLYFNSPRGCRNGLSCNFLHDAAPEKTFAERTRSDISQPPQLKKSRVDMAEMESK